MRRIIVFSTSILIAFSAVPAAQAQVVCSLIAKYFKSPPDGFINERGAQITPRTWKSNQNFPNSRCVIRLLAGEHIADCKINRGSSLDTVVAFGKSVESDIDSCLSQIPEGNLYKKTARTNTYEGTLKTATEWEYDTGTDIYLISVSAVKDSDTNDLYNELQVSWQHK